MLRLAVVLGLMLVAGLAGGCPRKITTNGRGGAAPTPRSTRPLDIPDDALVQGDESETTDGELDTAAGLTGEGADESGAEPVSDDSPADDVTDEPGDAIETDGETSALDGEAVDEAAEPGAEVDEEPVTDEAPLKNEAAVEDVVEDEPFEEPKFVPEPPEVKLSREAVRFAGSWQAVVFDIGGESEGAAGERIVMLSDSGSFEATALNRDGRLESGIWSMDQNIITLSFGPAGGVDYIIDQPVDNIAIWHGPNGGAMFCIRLPDETMAMSPGERYGSGFGPVEFSRSGPGYWKGSYGDPEGNLVLQNEGPFLFGTWEQGKQAGYAIFEFNQRSFEGFWWYSGQTSFGGEWNGEMQR